MMMNQLNTYKKDFMNIKFISDDDLPLGKTFNILDIIIVVVSVLEKNDKCYSQIVLQECTYKLWKCYSTKKLIFQKELTLIKQVHQKNVCFVIIGILKVFDLNSNRMFVINVRMYWWLLMHFNVKGVDFRCILWGISRDEAVNRLHNSVL